MIYKNFAGEIVASGAPADTAKEMRSYTDAFLKPVLAMKLAGPKKRGQQATE